MKEKNVIEFYVLCNKLKDVVRTGWKNWNVKRERVESIAEHIYGTQMLAIAMWSEYQYDIDLKKVLSMLAIHELEETKIGDLTIFDIDRETKNQLGHKAIEEILKNLLQGETIKQLILEFDERQTKEAQFAFFCDKLEADLQCKLYDEQNCVDITKHLSKDAQNSEELKKSLFEEGGWSKSWLKFSRERYNYDENFLSVSNYATKNDILSKK